MKQLSAARLWEDSLASSPRMPSTEDVLLAALFMATHLECVALMLNASKYNGFLMINSYCMKAAYFLANFSVAESILGAFCIEYFFLEFQGAIFMCFVR